VTVYAASVLAAPSGEVDGDWFVAKAQGTAVGLGAFAATSGVTSGLKSVVSRERPDGSGDDSFPSGHASTAAVFDTLTVRVPGRGGEVVAAARELGINLRPVDGDTGSQTADTNPTADHTGSRMARNARDIQARARQTPGVRPVRSLKLRMKLATSL
jgi:hypothetical protein